MGKVGGRVFKIGCYKNGVETLEEVECEDIVILNVMKRGMALGEEIRKKNERVKILYITGCDRDVLNSFKIGEFWYMEKPFDAEFLHEKIAALIDSDM